MLDISQIISEPKDTQYSEWLGDSKLTICSENSENYSCDKDFYSYGELYKKPGPSGNYKLQESIFGIVILPD